MILKAAALVLAALLALTSAGCAAFCEPQASEDEIKVNIKLELEEDIGLFLTDWTVNGQSGMSGSSNADGSMIKRSGTEYWSFNKQFLEEPAEEASLTLRFIVVTEYFEPDYDFDYPEECMIPAEPISFTAEFGKIYHVTVTGSNANGYQAVLNADQ